MPRQIDKDTAYIARSTFRSPSGKYHLRLFLDGTGTGLRISQRRSGMDRSALLRLLCRKPQFVLLWMNARDNSATASPSDLT
jgi:hypothetical protein